MRNIKSINSDKKTITLDSPLKYRHYSAVETYTSGSVKETFPMRYFFLFKLAFLKFIKYRI